MERNIAALQSEMGLLQIAIKNRQDIVTRQSIIIIQDKYTASWDINGIRQLEATALEVAQVLRNTTAAYGSITSRYATLDAQATSINTSLQSQIQIRNKLSSELSELERQYLEKSGTKIPSSDSGN